MSPSSYTKYRVKFSSELEMKPFTLNANNLHHAHLAELRPVDSVDEPAAKPDGLFHAGQRRIARDTERLIAFALGVSNTPPTETASISNPAARPVSLPDI